MYNIWCFFMGRLVRYDRRGFCLGCSANNDRFPWVSHLWNGCSLVGKNSNSSMYDRKGGRKDLKIRINNMFQYFCGVAGRKYRMVSKYSSKLGNRKQRDVDGYVPLNEDFRPLLILASKPYIT